MKSALSTLFVLGVVGSAIACGGAVAGGIDGQGGPGPGSDSDSGIPSHYDGGTLIFDGGSPSACGNANQLDLPAVRACLDAQIQFDDPFTLSLEVDSTGYSCLTCSATVSDGTVRIEIDGQTCQGDGPCDTGNVTVSCAIPALISGPYTVYFTHGDELSQVNINATSGAPTSCALQDAQPLDASNYDTSCDQDFDCTLVQTGDPCAACNCNEVAIAQSSQATYENDLAIQMAECPLTPGQPPGECGCPALATPQCVNHVCQATPRNTNGG